MSELGEEHVIDLDPSASKAEHEAAVTDYLLETDAQFGAILTPYLDFDRLGELTDNDRRRISSEIAARIREALDAEGDEE